MTKAAYLCANSLETTPLQLELSKQGKVCQKLSLRGPHCFDSCKHIRQHLFMEIKLINSPHLAILDEPGFQARLFFPIRPFCAADNLFRSTASKHNEWREPSTESLHAALTTFCLPCQTRGAGQGYICRL